MSEPAPDAAAAAVAPPAEAVPVAAADAAAASFLASPPVVPQIDVSAEVDPSAVLPLSPDGASAPDAALFTKTLQSDVGESAALTMLLDVQSSDPVFAAFDEDDLERLARYLSVLSFSQGDQIITAGEPASFCGIVLGGRFEAVLADGHRVPLPRGGLVGEMSWFEGGRRTADIVAADASVLAVISFADLKKLQPLEGEVVGKFLHMLAVVSMRKLRGMVARAQGSAEPAPLAAVTPATPSAAGAGVGGDAASAGDAIASEAQESLFVARLKADAASAKSAAWKANAKVLKASKAQRDAGYRAANLEKKVAMLEHENDSLREAARLAYGPAAKNKERVKLLTEQLTVVSKERTSWEGKYHKMHQAAEQATLAMEDCEVRAAGEKAALEAKLSAAIAADASARAQLSEEQSRLLQLTQTHAQLLTVKASLEHDLAHVIQEFQQLRAQHILLQERVQSLDTYRREFAQRLGEEELAHISWKSKADLILGDYTRLQSRVKELERVSEESTRERRGTLRQLAQTRHLIKKLIVRNFIRNVHTRKLLFAAFTRVNTVSTVSVSADSTDEPSGGSTSGGASETSAAASLRLQKKERARVLSSLKAQRTPVSRLVSLLDEDLSAFESPFRSMQAESAQLRATLDAFFKRNIQLTQSFCQAKETYEALHKEYNKLRESWVRMHQQREQERAQAAAAAGSAGAAAPSVPTENYSSHSNHPSMGSQAWDQQHQHHGSHSHHPSFSHSASPSHGDDDDLSSSPPPTFAPLHSPAPFSPISAASLRSGQSYSSTLAAAWNSTNKSVDAYGSLTNMSLAGPGPGPSRPGTAHGTGSSSSQGTGRKITVTSSSSSSASPRPPSAPATSPHGNASSRLSSPRHSRPLTSAAVRGGQPASSFALPGHSPVASSPSPFSSSQHSSWPTDQGDSHNDVSQRSQALRARILSTTSSPRPASSPRAAARLSGFGTPPPPARSPYGSSSDEEEARMHAQGYSHDSHGHGQSAHPPSPLFALQHSAHAHTQHAGWAPYAEEKMQQHQQQVWMHAGPAERPSTSGTRYAQGVSMGPYSPAASQRETAYPHVGLQSRWSGDNAQSPAASPVASQPRHAPNDGGHAYDQLFAVNTGQHAHAHAQSRQR